jgi:protein TonB
LTIKESDGTKRYEIRDLKSDKLVSLESYKKNIPVGKWITVDGQELDYDFELVYSKKEYTNVIKFDIYGNKPIEELKGKFEAPVFPRFRNNFRLYVAENLRYPVKALEKGIQGSVVSQFIIDEDGKIVNLSILESAHKILDKEAARAILESPEWIPAKIDGKPVKVYVVIRNTFFFKTIVE